MMEKKAAGGFFALAVILCCSSFLGCPSSEVVVVDNFPQLQLDAIYDSVVSFFTTGTATPIEVGDIIVGSDGGGFLRRVLGIDQDNGEVTTVTEFVSLAEAVEDGELNAVVDFAAETFAKAGAPMAKSGDTAIDLAGTVLYDGDGIKVTIVNGTLDFAPTVTLNAVWENYELTELNTYTEGDYSLSMDVCVEVTGPMSYNKEWPLYTFSQPWVFYIGAIPVTGTITLSFPIGVTGTVDGNASVTSGFETTGHVSLGGQLVDGEWVDMTDFVNDGATAHDVLYQFSAGVGLDVYVKAIVGLNLYNCSSLTGTFKPYFAFDSWLYPAPQTLTIGFGMDGQIAYDFSILGYSLYNNTWDFIGADFDPPLYWEIYRTSWN